MTVREFNRLLQKAVKEPLTPGEHASVDAYLADNPEAESIWEEEFGLNDLLDTAADFPVSSNFTAQVLQAVERENALEREEATSFLANFFRNRWSIPAATAILAIALAFALNHQQARTKRAEVAETVATVSSAAEVATVEMLKDFEIVTYFGQIPEEVDEELLIALEGSE